ncbi:hypothetical protein K466DRAFT_395339 [Polyporus arcularius HHB13444]|uniref:Uncharacterized protein n=1 Tax=Polyporus arcularius HHB13444 TaxID=1314778 RepID=A0A5C3NU40_9APHY|nr:hypothetical protein K466DRAFT_395339 [Polyporus arcularius HHB13444]
MRRCGQGTRSHLLHVHAMSSCARAVSLLHGHRQRQAHCCCSAPLAAYLCARICGVSGARRAQRAGEAEGRRGGGCRRRQRRLARGQASVAAQSASIASTERVGEEEASDGRRPRWWYRAESQGRALRAQVHGIGARPPTADLDAARVSSARTGRPGVV